MVQARPQRQMVNAEIFRGPLIHTQGFATQSPRLALNKYFRCLHRKPREVHFSLLILVAIPLRIRPSRRPARQQQHDCTWRNSAVHSFPLLDAARRQAVIGILRTLSTYIQYDSRPKELLCRNLIYCGLTRWEMHRRVQMRAVMLQHPEAPRVIAVFLDGGIYLGLKPFFVARPRHQFVIDGVTQIDYARFSRGYAL